MEQEAQRKDKERQEEGEVTEDQRFIMQERARGFPLSEEALLVFEAWDLNVEQCTKVAAAVPAAMEKYPMTVDYSLIKLGTVDLANG